MLKIKIIIVIIIAILFLAVVAVRFVSGEDDWICNGGQWIKHGNPSSSMPTVKCK